MLKIILITLSYILIILNFVLTKKIKSNYKKINKANEKEMKRQDFLIDMYKAEQGTLLQNAQELREKTADLESILKEINNIATRNPYNNEKVSLRKIKELVQTAIQTNS